MIRILIAEDSPVVQRTLVTLLRAEDGIEVVGVAENGVQAVELCCALRPDLVTMDVFMPVVDGLEATRAIMECCPTRIVIISSLVNDADLNTSFEAMRAGAVEIIEKPRGLSGRSYSDVQRKLGGILRNMVSARPERTQMNVAAPTPSRTSTERPEPSVRSSVALLTSRRRPQVVCLGGSSGAPAVLVSVLGGLAADYPIPIVLAQHIARGFGRGLVSWLDQSIALRVQRAADGAVLEAGTVTVAPDDQHLEIRPGGQVNLAPSDSTSPYTPSIDRFFSSAAHAFGSGALAVLLSGMGRDGAEGLLALRQAGALTLAQDEETSVVYGMPREALECGAAERAISPAALLALLRSLC